MKKYFIFLFLLISCLFPNYAKAITYQEVDQNTMQYNINNFYLSGDYIVINGWGLVAGRQHFTGSDTHEFSMVLTDKSTGNSKVYVAELKYANKTNLMKATQEKTACWRTDAPSSDKCYYDYSYAGFEFRIPISDLGYDREFDIKFRIYLKTVNSAYQESIYVLGINNSYDKDGVRYQLYSDIAKTSVTINSEYLFVRSGPGQSYAYRYGSVYCGYNTNLYWYPLGTFNHILGAAQTNPGAIDSELWVNLGFNALGYCILDKSRVADGTSDNGWAPWIYMVGSGAPATIRTISLENTSIEGLKVYTVPKGTQTKAILDLKNNYSDTITVKAYHDNNLVFSNQYNFDGKKTIEINYNVPDNGTLKIEVFDRYKNKTISSKVYVSSEKTYTVSSSDTSGIINVETPVMVYTNGKGQVTEYKEKVQLKIDPVTTSIAQGRGINLNSVINYWYPLDEFSLNSDYYAYALFPSGDDSLEYEKIDNMLKVNLISDNIQRSSNVDVGYLHIPDVYINKKTGQVYSSGNSEDYYIQNRMWYPSFKSKLGNYGYKYIASNVGINKITVVRELSYNINKTMFGNNSGKFYIKRVENPKKLNIIYKKTLTYDELLSYGGNE